MWLGKAKKTQGRRLYKPLGERALPPAIEPSRLDTLVTIVRQGNATEENYDEIFFGHIRLTLEIVSRYVWQAPHLEDDMIGESMIALISAIRKAKDKLYDNNITSYIASAVHSKIHRLLLKSPVVKIAEHKIKEGCPGICGIENIEILDNKEEEEKDVLETVESAVEAEDNRRLREYKGIIVRLRQQGYNDSEIAEILSCSHSTVSRLKAEVRDEYDRIKYDRTRSG